MRVVGRQITQRAGLDRCQEKMRAFVPGEVIPVSIQKMSEDLRLDLAGGLCSIAIRIALVACRRIHCRDRRAIRINCGSKHRGAAVGRPDGVASLSRNVGQLLRVARRAGRAIEIRQPDLLGARAAAEEENVLAVGSKLRSSISGLRHGQLHRGLRFGVWTSNRLQPQLRCFGVFVQIDCRNGVGQPFAVG